MAKQVPPHPIVAAAIAARRAAGLGVRITFNDGAPDFTGDYCDETERDRVLAKARTLSTVASAEIIAH